MTLDAVAAAVRQLATRLKSELGVAALYVFGSVARGEARGDSDVDVLVEFDGTATFARFMDLKALLEDTLAHALTWPEAPIELSEWRLQRAAAASSRLAPEHV